MMSCSQKNPFVNDSLEHKGLFGTLDGLWTVCVTAAVLWRHAGLCSLCGQAALMRCLSYLMPGKVNEVVALLEEVEMG